MKSEFALAFNQICAEYSLPREVVLDAVRAALVTAYRRDEKISNTQNITAEISLETGLAHIYLEKTVVDKVEDPATQISLKNACKHREDAQLDELLMIDVTPRNFGRIAAQTAKQVIMQRLREAERESQFNRFSRQENEIIIGTIHSVNPQGVTLHLERTEEALMPRREQIPGERYTLHQKIRVYVLEVRRTPRGPEIIVSRSHPLMLRRLLELEVPEIRNGQVEIKAIAREAGARAKVAVTARQPGLDPVGACVGMRGIRIQTISRELHGERVDVVAWHEDEATFIANALSMNRVLNVVLDPHNPGGRTASVIVMDDQLSLAIGRSGQNARLAAKLTNWRIDIQGATEAALWTLEQVNTKPELLDDLKGVTAMIPRLANIMRLHENDKYPYTDEELKIITVTVEAVRYALIARRNAERPAMRQARARRNAQARVEAERLEAKRDARSRVPKAAYAQELGELGLQSKVLSNLLRSGLTSTGDLMERVALGDEALLMLDGVGVKVLQHIKDVVEESDWNFLEPGEPLAEVTEEEVVKEQAVAEVAVEEIAVVAEEVTVEAEVPTQPEAASVEEEVEVVASEPLEAEDEALEEAVEVEEEVEEEKEEPEPAAPVVDEAVSEDDQAVEAQDSEEVKTVAEVFNAEALADVIPVYDTYEEEEEFEDRSDKSKKRRRRKRRPVVYDDETGETFVVRKHRRHGSVDWQDYGDDY